MDLNNLTYESIQRYFNRLQQVGYVNYNLVNTLLVLTYIQEIYNNYLDTDSLFILNKALSCIQGGSCLIPLTGCKEACV